MAGRRRPARRIIPSGRSRKTDLLSQLGALEELAARLGIEVRYEAMGEGSVSTSGGLCRLRAREIILVDRNAPLAEQVGVLLEALGQLDLEAVWVPPAIRTRLERRKQRRR